MARAREEHAGKSKKAIQERKGCPIMAANKENVLQSASRGKKGRAMNKASPSSAASLRRRKRKDDAREHRDGVALTRVARWACRASGVQVEARTLCEDLLDGVALCRLLSRFDDGGVSTFHKKPRSKRQGRENVSAFLDACVRLGFEELFSYQDLRCKNSSVIVHALTQVAMIMDGPAWDQIPQYDLQDSDSDDDTSDDEEALVEPESESQATEEGSEFFDEEREEIRFTFVPGSTLESRTTFDTEDSESELEDDDDSGSEDSARETFHKRRTRSQSPSVSSAISATSSVRRRRRRKKKVVSVIMGLIGLGMMSGLATGTILAAELVGVVNVGVGESLGVIEPEPTLWFF